MVKRTAKLEDEIVERISRGETLRSICRDKHMPVWQAVYQWMDKDEVFAGRIARAREVGYDAIAEQTVDIADEDMPTLPSGGRDGAAVQHAKLRIETRLKLLAKWSPKKYGERTHLEHSGKVGLESLVADDSE